MDEEKKDELENKDEIVEENKTSAEEATFVPEQLDDDDFEKEKEKMKAEKKAKKKAKKEKKEPELDENGNPINPKRNKSSIITKVIIAIIIILIIGGIVGYLVYNLNKPENAIIDFIAYVNEEDWDSAFDLIDFKGYLTMVLIDMESSDDESSVSYENFEEKYDTVYEGLANEGYTEIENVIEYGNENYADIFDTIFTDITFTVDSVNEVDRIGKTNLYKINITITMSDDTGTYSNETTEYEIYVAKIDGKYKMVDGTFNYTIYYYIEQYYAYTQYYTE